MFSVQVTDAWGASEAVQSLYLIERRLDLASTTEPVFQVRQRDSGVRLWVKCSDGSPESVARLAAEARLLARLKHRHVLPLTADHSSGDAPHLAYAWAAQEPLSIPQLAQIPAATRARLAYCLVDVVSHLQSLPLPVAHRRLALENLWLAGNSGWLQLAGLNHARETMTAEELQADRRQALELSWTMLSADGTSSKAPLNLVGPADSWLFDGSAAFPALAQTLRREFLAEIAEDL